ncbi:uncharacterized protein LOC111047125 [Nilaparvata lugens]|uniref:uncharacterized protein LOC111047125 n=1 Tax=Nilaparvata lugens TaxID=108931 RepID=UPI00193E5054|nr:uncharacterized protein LOC111047125 [Nilaparvata lugens]
MLKHIPGVGPQPPQLHTSRTRLASADVITPDKTGTRLNGSVVSQHYRISRPIQPPQPITSLLPTQPQLVSNGGLHLSSPPHVGTPASLTPGLSDTVSHKEPGVREMLTSLGLLCLISLLLALLSLIFLLKISPVSPNDVIPPSDSFPTVLSPDEYVVVYEVTLALCALSLSLNLCCLLVCSVQFLFAVKLVRDSPDGERTNKYLKKSSITRVCAVGGFFVSIPVFLTGLILYTFIQFHSTPAILTSGLIGFGIVFCGCAMVHNVFVWQKEKTDAVRSLARKQRELQMQHAAHLQQNAATAGATTPNHHVTADSAHLYPHHHHTNYSTAHALRTSSHSAISSPHHSSMAANGAGLNLAPREASGSGSPSVPHATLDLSSVATTPHELSTLV